MELRELLGRFFATLASPKSSIVVRETAISHETPAAIQDKRIIKALKIIRNITAHHLSARHPPTLYFLYYQLQHYQFSIMDLQPRLLVHHPFKVYPVSHIELLEPSVAG